MKDYASKVYIRAPRTEAASSNATAWARERFYRRAFNGAGWVLAGLVGVMVGWNLNMWRDAQTPQVFQCVPTEKSSIPADAIPTWPGQLKVPKVRT